VNQRRVRVRRLDDGAVRAPLAACPPPHHLDGRYSFSNPEPLAQGELRPLREPHDLHSLTRIATIAIAHDVPPAGVCRYPPGLTRPRPPLRPQRWPPGAAR
jgi:hypothetical protein